MPNDLIEQLRGKLIVSCQDYAETMIRAAVVGGAAGLRIDYKDLGYAKAFSPYQMPVLGCYKADNPDDWICITSSIVSAKLLIDDGADMVALDARNLKRPAESVAEIVEYIHSRGKLAVADIGTSWEALKAIDAGADIVATTFCPVLSLERIYELKYVGCTVLAEGHINTPEQARQALAAGAWAVCVGTAITRPHVLTARFVKAMEAHNA